MRFWHLLLQSSAYALYAVVAFVVFLYITFPYDALQQRVIDRLSQEGMQLTLARLQPAFPPGVRAQGLRLVIGQWSEDDAALQVDVFRLQPEWLPLLSGKLQARFEAGLYGGHLDGEVRQTQAEGRAVWDVKTHFTDVDLTQHPWVRRADKPFLRGRLGGDTAVLLTDDGHMQDGTFTLRGQPLALVSLPGGQLQLQREIACDTLQGELKTTPKQGGTLVLTCQGKDLAIDARGTVSWRTPVAESQLNLRWQVRSEEVYKSEMDLLAVLVRKRPDRRGELSFRLQGPLRHLRVGA